jgi:hypothetical protein
MRLGQVAVLPHELLDEPLFGLADVEVRRCGAGQDVGEGGQKAGLVTGHRLELGDDPPDGFGIGVARSRRRAGSRGLAPEEVLPAHPPKYRRAAASALRRAIRPRRQPGRSPRSRPR